MSKRKEKVAHDFPVMLYVRRESGSDGSEYFVVCEKYEECAELGSVVPVGIYRLVQNATVTTLVSLND